MRDTNPGLWEKNPLREAGANEQSIKVRPVGLVALFHCLPQHRDMEPQKTPRRDRKEFHLNQTKVNSTPQHHGTAEVSPHLNSLT